MFFIQTERRKLTGTPTQAHTQTQTLTQAHAQTRQTGSPTPGLRRYQRIYWIDSRANKNLSCL